MKVLFLAPEPFYQERGTPIAIDLFLRSLSHRGWDVDVLTYHEGQDVVYPRVRIMRIPRIPGVRNIRPGFSIKKLICDSVLFVQALWLALRKRYDFIHCVEESVFIGIVLRVLTGLPFVYDMDSSLPQQLADAKPLLRPFAPVLRGFEALAIRRADAVVAVCETLADLARRHGAKRVFLLHDVSLAAESGSCDGRAVKGSLGLREPCLMYIGNLERYQGIDLLLRSFQRLLAGMISACLIVVGGVDEDVDRYKTMSRQLGIHSHVHFLGRRPLSEIGELMAAAEILVSPRIKGGNAPMKIYSYMQSGKAILATDLPTHRQVLAPDRALLRPAEPEAFAEGMARLVSDPGLRSELGKQARAAAHDRYGVDAFERTVDEYASWMENLLAARVRLDSPLAVHFIHPLTRPSGSQGIAREIPGLAAPETGGLLGPEPVPARRPAREMADIESSSEGYARRFSGPAGAWLLSVQERTALGLMSGLPVRNVLDVGGGHGQLAHPLCGRGYDVTVLGSSEACCSRVRSLVEEGRCRFVASDLLALPFPDGAFDMVLCFRLLAHCEQWRLLLREVCRVSRQAVLVEYPNRQGPNAVGPLLFRAKKRLEGNTRPWRSFQRAELARELSANGFAVAANVPELFLPTVLHRQLGSARVSSVMEHACRRLGFTPRWGSPVILMGTRSA